MLFKIYTVYDMAAKEAGPLFTAKNDSVALRHFEQINESIHKNFKSDYKLIRLGEYITEDAPHIVLEEPSEVTMSIDKVE